MSVRVLLLMILVAMFAGACHRNNGGGISAVPGGFPPSSSPNEVSSSAQVVKVATLPTEIVAGGSADAIVRLSIMPGYHINANPATFSYLIATEVQAGPDPDHPILPGRPIYPAAVKKKFAFADQPLDVYEGEIEIKLPMSLPTKSQYVQIKSGLHLSQPITARVQACDNEKCFPPATLSATIPIEVK